MAEGKKSQELPTKIFIAGVGGAGNRILKDLTLGAFTDKWANELKNRGGVRIAFCDTSQPTLDSIRSKFDIDPQWSVNGDKAIYDDVAVINLKGITSLGPHGAYRTNIIGWHSLYTDKTLPSYISGILEKLDGTEVFLIHHLGGGTGSLGVFVLSRIIKGRWWQIKKNKIKERLEEARGEVDKVKEEIDDLFSKQNLFAEVDMGDFKNFKKEVIKLLEAHGIKDSKKIVNESLGSTPLRVYVISVLPGSELEGIQEYSNAMVSFRYFLKSSDADMMILIDNKRVEQLIAEEQKEGKRITSEKGYFDLLNERISSSIDLLLTPTIYGAITTLESGKVALRNVIGGLPSKKWAIPYVYSEELEGGLGGRLIMRKKFYYYFMMALRKGALFWDANLEEAEKISCFIQIPERIAVIEDEELIEVASSAIENWTSELLDRIRSFMKDEYEIEDSKVSQVVTLRPYKSQKEIRFTMFVFGATNPTLKRIMYHQEESSWANDAANYYIPNTYLYAIKDILKKEGGIPESLKSFFGAFQLAKHVKEQSGNNEVELMGVDEEE